MGVDYSTYVVIGCEIDKEKLYISEKVRSCDCDVDGIENMSFCSKCGKTVWKEIEDTVEGYDESKDTLFGYDLRYGTDHERCWVIIRGARADDKNSAIKLEVIDNISELREELKAAIGPAGFWEEKKFGIWAIHYCSY